MRLRLSVQSDPGASLPDAFAVDAELQDGSQTWKETSKMCFSLSGGEREDLRWYWEDFADTVLETALTAAERAHAGIAAAGDRLFQSIFNQNSGLRTLWGRAATSPLLRVEIACADLDSDLLPWELMRAPGGSYVAVQATEFTRVPLGSAAAAPAPSETLRVLIIISRPYMYQDVSYQAVTRSILQKVSLASQAAQLSLLRPPTFEAMKSTLRAAAEQGRPFQIVHFDGHGVYIDGANQPPGAFLSPPAPGRRGYLLFEKRVNSYVNELSGASFHYVTGEEFGGELAATGVQAAVFNACRSGYAASPDLADYLLKSRSQFWQPHTYGSLADEVMKAGVLGVVAMRYDVHVESAATYMAELYQHLAHGSSLSTASTRARRLLYEAPPIKAGDARGLEDWPVPVCYERLPATLANVPETGVATAADADPLAADFPAMPSWVRSQERTVFFLDRAFDLANIVNLVGMRGSGKTSIAAQFASWYGATAGISKTLWTQLAAKPSASEILAAAADRFREELQPRRDEWEKAGGSHERAHILAEAIAQSNVLWVWDSLDDLLAGAVPGAAPVSEDIAIFVTLLVKLSNFRVKLLLVSRGRRSEWLPVRVVWINTSKFDDKDSGRLLAAHGTLPRWLDSPDSYARFVQWADGNPLALRLALHEDAPPQIPPGTPPNRRFDDWAARVLGGRHPECAAMHRAAADLVEQIRSGFGDAALSGLRTVSLFRGRISPQWTQAMSAAGDQGSWTQILAAAAGFGFAAGAALLPPEQETDWLLHPLLGPAVYAVTQTPPLAQETGLFIETAAALAAACHDLYTHGRRDLGRMANDQLANFYDAWYRARGQGMVRQYLALLAGMMVAIYHHRGDAQEWAKLIETVLPDFVEPDFSAFKSGSEVPGSRLVQMYIQPLMDLGREPEAERALKLVIPFLSARASPVLEKTGQLTRDEATQVLSLFNVLTSMGELLLKRRDAACVPYFNDSLRFAERSGDRTFIAIGCLNLGAAQYSVLQPPNLAKASEYLERSLALRGDNDFLGRGRCQFHVGNLHKVAWTEQLQHLSRLLNLAASSGVQADAQFPIPREALAHYEQAIALLKAIPCFELYASHLAVAQLNAMMHLSVLGTRSSQFIDASIQHFSRAAELAAILGDNQRYARTHLEAADLLKQSRRFDAARDHAKAAAAVYASMGEDGVPGQIEALRTLRDIKGMEALRPDGGPQ